MGAWLWLVAGLATAMGPTQPSSGGSEAKEPRLRVDGPTVVFVLPPIYIVDDFTRQGLRKDVARHDFRKQFKRIRDGLRATGVSIARHEVPRFVYKAQEGHATLDVSDEWGWTGVVLFCPGHSPDVIDEVLTDVALVQRVKDCAEKSKR